MKRTSLTRRVAAGRRIPALLAVLLVALQLVTALHFALVPHRFSAGLSGFVHVHTESAGLSGGAVPAELQPKAGHALTSGPASCPSDTSDTCPIGFAGHSSVLFASCGSADSLLVAQASRVTPKSRAAFDQAPLLLLAPKNSPPV